MEHNDTFESVWPELERRLRDALSRRRIPVDQREDVLQETALRLLRSWDRIDKESLTGFAMTVALNVIRDEARRAQRRDRVVGERTPDAVDAAREALARIELDRVRHALDSMDGRSRALLLTEIGEAAVATASTPAAKMARMRARRRLRALIEGASIYVSVSFGRFRKWLNDGDVGFANTAASLAVQLAAVGVLATGLPHAVGNDVGGADRSKGESTVLHQGLAGGPMAAASTSGVAGSSLSMTLEPSRTLRALAGNDHRGSSGQRIGVGTGGEGLGVEEQQVGPYGTHHVVSQAVGDSKVVAEVKTRYETTRCLERFVSQGFHGCGKEGSIRGRVRAAVDKHKVEARIGDSRVVQ